MIFELKKNFPISHRYYRCLVEIKLLYLTQIIQTSSTTIIIKITPPAMPPVI